VVVVEVEALAAEAPTAGPRSVTTIARVARAFGTPRDRGLFGDTG
jgi:hypothetical protein